jgi:hypothetical protein
MSYYSVYEGVGCGGDVKYFRSWDSIYDMVDSGSPIAHIDGNRVFCMGDSAPIAILEGDTVRQGVSGELVMHTGHGPFTSAEFAEDRRIPDEVVDYFIKHPEETKFLR